MINVLDAAQQRSYDPRYTDRAWLATELAALIGSAGWAELGGLAIHVALAVAPIAGLPARVSEAQALAPRTATPAWSAPVWVAAELGAHVAALTAPGSDLQALALRLAGAVARVAIP